MRIADRFHTAVGVTMAAQWGLPRRVTDVIARHHHRPDAADDPLVDVVRAADRVTRLLLDAPHVSAADLVASGAARTPAESEAVARALVHVPPLVAAFCDGPMLKRLTVPAAVDRIIDGVPVMLPATVVGGAGGPRAATCVTLSKSRLSLLCRARVPDNTAVQLTLQAPVSMTLWVLVRQCTVDAAGFAVDAQPFALSGDLKKDWYGLVDRFRAARPPR